jgi:DNA repair photolyase
MEIADQIGVTERGDPSLDFSWVSKLRPINIIITKNLTDEMIEQLLVNRDKIILHLTCTGMGGTALEPNIKPVEFTYNQVKKLISQGFQVEHIVLRIDPVIPTPRGIETFRGVIEKFKDTGIKRVRYSFLDMYSHVAERFINAGIRLPYESFTAPDSMINNALRVIESYDDDYYFECCAEKTQHSNGCISELDIILMRAKINVVPGGCQRRDCRCLKNKTELLESTNRCAYACLYCYWKD